MNSKHKGQSLSVFLLETYVGEIVKLADDQTVFAIDKTYANLESRPTLSLSFKSSTGGLIETARKRQLKLDPFFSNLLPEGHLRKYLAEKLEISSQREFYLLAALGDDLPGGVAVRPDSDLVDDFAGPVTGETSDEEPLRFSLAGVHLKFSAIEENNGRLTIPAKGQGGSWIIKIPASLHKNVPEVEYSMLKLAGACGISIPEIRLVPTSDIEGLPESFHEIKGNSLAVKRFDRLPDGQRIHMEDFAQVFGLYPHSKYGKRSYDNIAAVLQFETDERSVIEFVNRLVFTIAIGNGDMHHKNWTLLYEDRFRPILSPAYDFIPTIAYLPDQSLGLKLGGTRKFADVSLRNFETLAASARIPYRQVKAAVLGFAECFHEEWNKSVESLPIPPEVRHKVQEHFKRIPLLAITSSVRGYELVKSEFRQFPILVELDQALEKNELLLEDGYGGKSPVEAPEPMDSRQLAIILDRKRKEWNLEILPISFIAGQSLYRLWRSRQFIRLPHSFLIEQKLPGSTIQEHDLRISLEQWQRIEKAHREKVPETFDMLRLDDGALCTIEANIIRLFDIVTESGGSVLASLDLTLNSLDVLFAPNSARTRACVPGTEMNYSQLVTYVLERAGWTSIFANRRTGTFTASKKHQLNDWGEMLFQAEIQVNVYARKTVFGIRVHAEMDVDVRKDALMIASQLKELLESENRKSIAR